MSNIIPGCFGFALFLFVIGPENSRHFLNQSDAKLKPIATWLLASSRALVTCIFPRFDYVRFPALWLPAFFRALITCVSRALVSLPVSSQWLFSLFLVSHWDYNGFGLTTLNRRELFHQSSLSFYNNQSLSQV